MNIKNRIISFSGLSVLIYLAFFNYETGFAQYYERAYGNSDNTNGVFFNATPDHGIVILGNYLDTLTQVYGYYVLKTDSTGTVSWQRHILDAFNAYSNSITSLDDGRIVMLGTHSSPSFQNIAEVELLDTNGNYITSQVYPPFSGWGTAGVAIANSDDSSVVISLYNDGFISNNYYSVFSLNPDLSIKWNDFVGFDGSYTDAHGISSGSDESINTIAYYDNYNYSITPLYNATHLRRHDKTGNVSIDSIYQFKCVTTAVTTTKDGGTIICGTRDSLFQTDMVLIRIDSSGHVLWQKQYGSYLNEVANAVIETADSGFALLATVDDSVLPHQHDLLLLKTNSHGDSLWSRKFDGVLDEKGLHIKQDRKDLILMGSTTSFNNDHIYIVRTDSAGIIESPYSISASGRYFCSNDTAVLRLIPSPRPSMHILWSNGDTVNQAHITTTGNYFAVITDSLGNVIRTPFVPVYFTAAPNATFAPDTISLCSGTILNDTTTQDLTNTYQWYFNGSLLTGENSNSIIPQQKGSYLLIVKNNCASDTGISFIDTLFSLPTQPVITTPLIDFVCAGDSIALTVFPVAGEPLQWYTADANMYIIPGETDSFYYAHEDGNYVVEATNVNGCTIVSSPKQINYDHIQETVNPNGQSVFCQGGEVELSVSQGTNFLWSTDDTTQTITVNSSGQYFVSFINMNGCPKNSDTISITVLNNPIVSIGPDTFLCSGSSLIVDAGTGYNNYLWNDGVNGQADRIVPSGPFPETHDVIVFVTDAYGCTDSDTLLAIFDVCAGVKDATAGAFLLYPDVISAGDAIHVTEPDNRIYKFILSDDLGRVVVNLNLFHSTVFNETAHLHSGIYVYRLMNEGGVFGMGKMLVR